MRWNGPHRSPIAVVGAGALVALGLAGTAIADSSPDLNGDCSVNGADLGILLGGWGAAGVADLDGNGTVDGADLGIMLGAWGPAECLSITGIAPQGGPPGTIVKVTGTFLDPDPNHYCLVCMNETGVAIPFLVTAVAPDSIVATVGPVPPGMGACNLMIGTGAGNAVSPGIGGLPIGPGAWSWVANGNGTATQTAFAPQPDPNGGNFGGVIDGDICTEILGPFAKGTRLRLWPRAHHLGPPHVGYDAYIPCLAITETLDIAGTTARICEAVEAVYAAHEPEPVAVDCLVTFLPGGGARLCLSLPGLVADWGIFTIQALDPANLYFECDYDIDSVVDPLDNCIETPNGNQVDIDGDGVGDVCEAQPASIDGETFAVADFPVGPPGNGAYFHSVDHSRPSHSPDSAETGDFLDGEVRGMSEFPIAGLGTAASATLVFEATMPGGAFEQPSGNFVVNLVAYAGNGAEEIVDFQAPEIAALGSLSTTNLVIGTMFTFDVTAAYNAAVAAGSPALGIRLQRAADTGGTAWTFGNFVLNVVP